MFKNLNKQTNEQKLQWTHGTAAGDPKRQTLYKLLNRTNFALVCFLLGLWGKKKKKKLILGSEMVLKSVSKKENFIKNLLSLKWWQCDYRVPECLYISAFILLQREGVTTPYISSLLCRHDNRLANPGNCDQFTCGPSVLPHHLVAIFRQAVSESSYPSGTTTFVSRP